MAARQTTGHKLKRNHSNAIPRYIIALDTETQRDLSSDGERRFSHRFRIAVIIVGRLARGKIVGKRAYRCRSKAEIWRIIKQYTGMNYTTWLVCHNALFDMVISGMPEQFENASLTIDRPRAVRKPNNSPVESDSESGLCCIESPPIIIGCRVGTTQGRLVIVDTLNWFQCPLSDLGRSCGLEKLPMPAFSASDEDWYTYCERDTEITFLSFVKLIEWVKDNDMGMFRYTGPAQAMAAFRHRFMEHDILIHDNLPVKVIERSAYFGGRFECWKLGEINETVHQLDVNALFPSVMRDNSFPTKLENYDLSTSWRSVDKVNIGNNCIAEVLLDCSADAYPYRTRNGVCFPTGSFKTTLCGCELGDAIQCGVVSKVRSIAQYRSDTIFARWVADMWRMRADYKSAGNLLYERFTKTLMNSLYGKFGQRSPEWINVSDRCDALPWMTWVDYDASSGERVVYRSFGWQVQKQQDREERHHAEMPVSDWQLHAEQYGKGEIDSSFVAISAFVTAYARVRMNKLRATAGPENVLYQGVDSLIVNNAGKQRLEDAEEVSETELGKLRLQLSANYGWINGCSDYTIGDKIVIAGLPRRTTESERLQGLQRTFAAKPHLFQGKPCDTVTESLSPWRKAGSYWKGNVDQSGYVTPLVFPSEGSCSSEPSKPAAVAVSAKVLTIT